MPENVTTQTCHDSDGVTKQDLNSSHQSAWVAHWMSTTNSIGKSATKPTCSRLLICHEPQEEVNRAVGKGSEKPGNESEECEKRSTELVRSADEKPKSLFPMFNLQRKGDDVLARKEDRPSSSHRESTKPGTECNDMVFQLFSLGGNEKHLKDLPPMIQWVHGAKNPPREDPFAAEDVLADKEEGVDGRSTKGEFVVSSSKVVPYGFNFGKTMGSSISKHEEINRPDFNPMFSAHDKTVSNPFQRSRNPLENDARLLPRDPSTSRTQQPEFVAKKCQKMHELSGDRLFSSESNPVDLTRTEKYHGCLSLPSPPCHSNDMEAVRALTAVDSVEVSSRGREKFPTSTSHQFLLAKTEFNSTGGQIPMDSMILAKLKERYSSETFRFDQDAAFPITSRVKLRLLGSSTGSEEEKDAEEFKTSSGNIRNESSSETKAMDVNTFQKNHVSGVVSSSSKKFLQQIELEHQTPTAQDVEDSSAREIEALMRKRKFPDMNQQPNDLTVCASSADTSTSRTQSLDAEHLLLYAEQPIIKCNKTPARSVELETSRWFKRLKKSPASSCAAGSSKMGEDNGSHEKVNTIFSKIMKFTLTGSDPITSRFRPKDLAGLTHRAMLPSNRTMSVDSTRRNHEPVTLSHPWVRRLCLNTAASSSEKSKAAEVSESRHSAENPPEKKQFPSLGAMALMGKALGGYQGTCQFKKKGSSLVWSS